MKNSYENIEKFLNSNPGSSLNLSYWTTEGGIKDVRSAEIEQPGIQGDNYHTIINNGETIRHKGHRAITSKIYTKDIYEAIDLMDKKCEGLKVQNTIVDGSYNSEREYVHGSKSSNGNLDEWIKNGLKIDIESNGDEFRVRMFFYKFGQGAEIIQDIRDNSITKLLTPYEENNISEDIPRHIYNGIFMQKKILKDGRNPISTNELGRFDETIRRRMESALEKIDSFNFSKKLQSALIYSILVDELFKKNN